MFFVFTDWITFYNVSNHYTHASRFRLDSIVKGKRYCTFYFMYETLIENESFFSVFRSFPPSLYPRAFHLPFSISIDVFTNLLIRIAYAIQNKNKERLVKFVVSNASKRARL